MNTRKLLVIAILIAAGLAAMAGSIAMAHNGHDHGDDMKAEAKSDAMPEMKLPPGWTEADMMACMTAATPGEQHERLAADAGVWEGKCTMWMYPGAEPVVSECKSVIKPIMDGRYFTYEYSGEMPGMGPYNGFGIQGYDNVSQEFVCTWIDNWSTGIMRGTGELSDEGKTITWVYTYNCPVTQKPHTTYQTDTNTGENTKKLMMRGSDPKTGEEFKMMEIELTRK